VSWFYATGWDASRSPLPGTTPVDIDAFHHQVFQMVTGNFVVMARETREYPDYPASYTDPSLQFQTAALWGDVVVELTPDGEIVTAGTCWTSSTSIASGTIR